jgi:PAS domain S-box-containing protein
MGVGLDLKTIMKMAVHNIDAGAPPTSAASPRHRASPTRPRGAALAGRAEQEVGLPISERETSAPPPAPGRLEAAVGALEQLAGALPGEAAVLAAVCDPRTERSDLLLRDERGQIGVVAGLSGRHRRSVESLLELGRATCSGRTLQNGASGHAEQEPEPSELHRRLTEGSPVPLLLLDPTGTIHLASPLVCEQLGFELDAELLGRRLVDLVDDPDREALERVWRGLRSSERVEAAITLRARRRDRGTLRLELLLRALPDESGWVVVALSEPHRARAALVDEFAAQRRLRALADSADCGTALVGLLDGEVGVLLDANLAFGHIAGVPSEELIGCAPEAIVDATDAPRLREALIALLRTGQPQRLRARLARRSVRVVELYARLDRSSGDPPQQLSLRVRDITEQRASSTELSGEIERLQQSNRELAELARVAAHDLAAPLRALTGLVDLLAPSAEPAGMEGTLGAIRSAIGRMQGMVDGMLGYTQSSTSDEPRRQPVDLEHVLEYVLESLRSEIHASGAVITATELPIVFGDPHQLERLLRNLLDNAIKYAGGERPRISLSAVAEGSGWLLAIADQGVGVPERDRKRIFELFERARANGTTDPAGEAAAAGGRGIGLAVCRRIVELHGGQIWIGENEPRGTIVQFTLPGEPAFTDAPQQPRPAAHLQAA